MRTSVHQYSKRQYFTTHSGLVLYRPCAFATTSNYERSIFIPGICKHSESTQRSTAISSRTNRANISYGCPLFTLSQASTRTTDQNLNLALVDIKIRVVEATFKASGPIFVPESHTRSPALLAVNQEARHEAKKVFKLFEWAGATLARINWDRDIVFFNTNIGDWSMSKTMRSMVDLSWMTECRRLAVSQNFFACFMSLLLGDSRHEIPRRFKLLEDLFIVSGVWQDGDKLLPSLVVPQPRGRSEIQITTVEPLGAPSLVADLRKTLIENRNVNRISLAIVARADDEDAENITWPEHMIDGSGTTDMDDYYESSMVLRFHADVFRNN